jgi:hypothetical protein
MNIMTRFSKIKNFLGLTKLLKKKAHYKTKPKKKKKKTNLSSFNLFTFVVLLSIDVGVVVITIHLLCSKKWLI